MRVIRLAAPIDEEGFRRHARALVMQQVHPDAVEWLAGGSAATSLWSQDGDDAPTPWPSAGGLHDDPSFKVPASFMSLCRQVLMNRDAQRFSLMYRLLWRLRVEPYFWLDRLHPERRLAERLAREVSHEIHKMRAFVRFTPVEDDIGTRHIAWFEPEHHIVEANAGFFVRRFAQMRWAILTPACSIEWDGQQLRTGPGGHRDDAPSPDAGAALWLTYYRHIFNPARLKVDMMVKEMPRRYWKNLPEAALIEPLIAAAGQRTEAMVQAGPTAPRSIRPMQWRREDEAPD